MLFSHIKNLNLLCYTDHNVLILVVAKSDGRIFFCEYIDFALPKHYEL